MHSDLSENQGDLTSVYKTEIVQNLVHHEPQLIYIYFCGGIMKITFFNLHDNFMCLIIFFWQMNMNSILNSKCKYERIAYNVYIVIEDSLLFEQYITSLEQTKLLYTKCKHCTPCIHLYCMCVFAAVL